MLFKTKFIEKSDAVEDAKKARKDYPEYRWKVVTIKTKLGKRYSLKSTKKK